MLSVKSKKGTKTMILYRTIEKQIPSEKSLLPNGGSFFSDNETISQSIHPYGTLYKVHVNESARILEIDANGRRWMQLELERKDFKPRRFYFKFKSLLKNHYANRKIYTKTDWIKDSSADLKDIDIIAIKNIREGDDINASLGTTYIVINYDCISKICLVEENDFH